MLPCHAAASIPHLQLENIREKSLGDIWYKSAAFNACRGTGWMPEPCASCERKEIDFSRCRCQAMLLAGDPQATDPVCSKAPGHAAIVRILDEIRNDEATTTPLKADTFEYRQIKQLSSGNDFP